MKSNYKRLGEYIVECNVINENNQVKELRGISNNKYFQKSQTNTIGIDLKKYRVVKKNEFAYNRATTRNGEKISIALNLENDYIVSPSYRVFKVKDENVLNSQYLMMWFKRSEFDRYARFKSHGSAHEFFEFAEMCDVRLPIPCIEEQLKIVKKYNSIINRINTLDSIIDKLDKLSRNIYIKWFIKFELPHKNNVELKIIKGTAVPYNWDVITLRDLCEVNPESLSNKCKFQDIEYLDTSNITNNEIKEFQLLNLNTDKIPSRAKRLVKNNDIIFSNVRPNLNHFGILRGIKENTVVSTGFTVLRPKNKNICSEIIYLTITQDNILKELQNKAEMAVSTYPSITADDLLDIVMPLPDDETLGLARKTFTPIFNLIKLYQDEKKYLEILAYVILSSIAKGKAMKFDELKLEKAIIQLFKQVNYSYVKGEQLNREISEVLIKSDLRKFLFERYKSEEITEYEVESIIRSLEILPSSGLYDSNKKIMNMISNGFTVKREDRDKKDLFIQLLDYENIDNNLFKIVNQMEIKEYRERIPDAIIYVNGLPLVVFEFKSAIREDATIYNAYTQLTVRYRRDIPELFKYNALCVISDGANNKAGSFFAPYEFFYSWRKIEGNEKLEKDGIDSLFTMVNGLFNQERFIDLVHNFIYFPDTSNKEEKIVPRYPQYYAANKLLNSIKRHMKPYGNGKGGTYFGATGCGKSFTMLYLTRLLMRDAYLQSPTIVLITDRTDLDDQLSKSFVKAKEFIGDHNIISVESRQHLREQLQNRKSGGIFLTTIQKFSEDIELLTDRANVVCISDEAHRSQINLDQKVKVTKDGVQKKYGFAKYLHDSLPNATYVGFTGTPIDETMAVFGDIEDSYTMIEAVYDEITVRIVYEGRAAKVNLDESKLREIEEYYNECAEMGANENQIEESKKAVTKMDAILGNPDRLKLVAKDFVEHYEKRVSEGASIIGKAMFVASNREIAYNLYKEIIALRPEWAEIKECDDGVELSENERKSIKPIEKIKMVMTRNKDDNKELYELLGTKEYRKELDRQYKKAKSNFKIAIVVDMWLTGFDVPELDTIYIDKPIQQHSLIQTISRVNRVYEGKEKGLVVDYIGIKSNMNIALKKYGQVSTDNFEGTDEAIVIVKNQLDLLSKLFYGFNNSGYFTGTPLEQLQCLNRAVEFAQQTEEIEKRFMGMAKKLNSAYRLCCTCEEISSEEKDRIHFYLAIKSILHKLTKGDAPDAAQMNEKVREMINEAIISEGVEEVFKLDKNDSEENDDIFSEDYLAKVNKIALPNTRIKLLQKLLSKAISEFKKVNKVKGVDFSRRMKALVELYNERKDFQSMQSDVLDDLADKLAELFEDLIKEKHSSNDLGISFEEKAFYDILKVVAEKHEFEYPHDKLIKLAKEIKEIVDDKAKYTDWSTRDDIKAELKVAIIITLDENGYPPVPSDEVFKEIFEQAENFKKYN